MPIRHSLVYRSLIAPLSLLLLPILPVVMLFGNGIAAADEKNATAGAVPVHAVAVTQQQQARTTTQPASIEPYYRADIRARLSGYVREVQVDIGDVVEAGRILALLDVPDLQKQADVIKARIRRLQAEESRAAAGITLSVASVRSSEAMLQQAKSQVAKDDALLKAASAEFERMQDLVGRGVSEPRLLDEAVRRKDAAAASRDSAMSAIVSAEANVVVASARQTAAEADLDVAKAETRIAQAELEEREIMLGYAQLKSPFNGVVTARTINPGDLVSVGNTSGTSPLFVISQIHTVRCQLSVPERDAAFVRRGDAISLTFPSFTAEVITTKVTRTSQSLDRQTRTMLVEAEIPNADGKLLPGMFGQATLSLQAPATASLLPARAVRIDGKGAAQVYVIRDDGTVAVTKVSIIADDGQMLQLTGVVPGQRVVDAHLNRFSEGQRVEIIDR